MFLEENNKTKIILASKSPRRADIFYKLNLDFKIVAPTLTNERIFEDPAETVIFNSLGKAENVAGCVKIDKSAAFKKSNFKSLIIAGFDTIVFLEGRFFIKPGSREEAREFLKIFSGKTHRVYSGVSLVSLADEKVLSGYDVTEVTFRKLDDEYIEDYLEKENVLDKAGAYNLDGYGCILVKKINGCFYNVAGLPVRKFLEMIEELGYSLKDFQK